MNQNEVITAVVALMVCGLLAGVTAIPLIAGISQETINEEYNDESNAGWLRMAYDNKPFDVEITADGDNITAGGQTGLNDDMILYADASACVMCVNGAFVIVNGYAATPEVINASSVAITNAGGSLTVEADGDTVITATSPAWAYYPDATGKYAYFGADVDGVKIKASDNHAFAGKFAGIYAYNNVVVAPDNLGDLGFSLNAVVEDDVITSVTWGESVADTLGMTAIDFDPSTITLQPLDPSIIDDPITSGGVGLMSADPTTGTRIGDFYYTFNSTRASVVGYASTINWQDYTSLPESVVNNGTTYTVYSVAGNAFNNSGCAFTSLPSSLRNIETNAFANCPDLKIVVIPVGIRNILSNAFYNSGLTDLIIMGTPNLNGTPFLNTNIKEVLNLGDVEITTTSYGLNADAVRDDIPASGYIAPLSTTAVVTKEGATYDLVSLLPLIMVLGVVMMGVYAVGTRYA